MSKTLVIPVDKLHYTINGELHLLPCIQLLPVILPFLDNEGEIIEGKVEIKAQWYIIVGARIYQIESCESKIAGIVGTYTSHFTFTGFYSTCENIVTILGIEDPEIY